MNNLLEKQPPLPVFADWFLQEKPFTNQHGVKTLDPFKLFLGICRSWALLVLLFQFPVYVSVFKHINFLKSYSLLLFLRSLYSCCILLPTISGPQHLQVYRFSVALTHHGFCHCFQWPPVSNLNYVTFPISTPSQTIQKSVPPAALKHTRTAQASSFLSALREKLEIG